MLSTLSGLSPSSSSSDEEDEDSEEEEPSEEEERLSSSLSALRASIKKRKKYAYIDCFTVIGINNQNKNRGVDLPSESLSLPSSSSSYKQV